MNKKYSDYITQYIKENLDEIKVRIPKGEKEKWKIYTEKRSESLNSLIICTLNRTIRDDEMKGYLVIPKKKEGGNSMNIDFRDSKGKLYSKDILDIALDMEVAKNKTGEFVINLNSNYICNKIFETENDAEGYLVYLSDVKNKLESELRNDL